MASVILSIYRTSVINGRVESDSTLTSLTIDDINNDGLIDTSEWQAYAGSPKGRIAGDKTLPGFWGRSSGNADRNASGILYTPTPFTEGQDVSGLLGSFQKSTFKPTVAELNVCYLAGTLIATPTGEVAVETLCAGDLVLTRDNGPQPLVWTGISTVTPAALDLAPNQRPLRIKAGAIGHGLPRRDVDLSPQHRILVTDAEGHEYLISARHLMMSGMPGISLRPLGDDFRLVHIACAAHQVLLAEGAPMESFFTGKMAVKALSQVERLELLMAFPDLGTGRNPMTPARPFIRHRDYVRMRDSVPQG